MTTSNSANTKQSNNASQKRKPILLPHNFILFFLMLASEDMKSLNVSWWSDKVTAQAEEISTRSCAHEENVEAGNRWSERASLQGNQPLWEGKRDPRMAKLPFRLQVRICCLSSQPAAVCAVHGGMSLMFTGGRMYPKGFSRKHHLSIYLRVGAFFISRKPNYPFAGIVCKHEDRRKIMHDEEQQLQSQQPSQQETLDPQLCPASSRSSHEETRSLF